MPSPISYVELFRWVVYFLVGMYVLYYCFCNKKKKLTSEQKVRYKYRLVNAEVIKTYTQQDTENMHILINNTIANLNIIDQGELRVRRKTQIRVTWTEELEQIRIFDRHNSMEIEKSAIDFQESSKELEPEDDSLLGNIFQE